MELVSVTIVSCESGDWSKLYVDRVLECEGHSVAEHEFVELINKYKNFKEIKSFEISDEEMEELGREYPESLEE